MIRSVEAAVAGAVGYEHAADHAGLLYAYSNSDMLYNHFHIYDI